MSKFRDFNETPYFEKIIKKNNPVKGRQDQKRKKPDHRNKNFNN